MRIILRLIASLIVVSTVVVSLFAAVQARHEERRLVEELDRRAIVLAESLQESVEPVLASGDQERLDQLVERFGYRPRLSGIAVYGPSGEAIALTSSLPESFRILPVLEAAHGELAQAGLISAERTWWHVQRLPLRQGEAILGTLVLFHDASYIREHWASVWRENFLRLLLLVLPISLSTLLIVQWTLLRPLTRLVDWLRGVKRGEALLPRTVRRGDVFGPLTREVTDIAKSLIAARAAAQEEAKLRSKAEARWTADRLSTHAHTTLQQRKLVIVANREPYMHVRDGKQIRCVVPASGLVTALEPVLRACGGTWIAHGAGDADRETVDQLDRIVVPPDEPAYTLRRVWLSKEEEAGYYYGFSNEGLWPLCHIAHTRPVFRSDDWAQYQRVNAKFADAVLQEVKGVEQPFVLVQDYHFALLPHLIKQARPDAKVALFWHIPWTNPEAFGICPWAQELLQGMLGSDVLGFHIQFHCNNFLETAERLLEARIDWEQFSIDRAGHTTWVKPFPISVATNGLAETAKQTRTVGRTKDALLSELGLSGVRWLTLGVDRIDYTKGILERFRAVERCLELHPELQRQFAFVELGAPSRTLLTPYHNLEAELSAEAERINRRFQARGWKPIVFLKKNHTHEDIEAFYRAADCCLVTSLHDGMNLVAKEFVAARHDERGVLILSRFAGASRELHDALLVNPYDVDQVAEAIHHAISMSPAEQQARMVRLRQMVQEHNVYRWAASLLNELARIRPEERPASSSSSPLLEAE
ncbi:MAG: trehalose-6-phosphate synthase [Candidatus Omnitrophica bacterium CG11_big_fil_rev_8_21_14_0_20_63_9]|nr:MAG: trehalose-6-phosphate synthase [Candidatus Omnitrophica bacterium CG11_big_fil_rev_8_21_14_0_20_63_9]